jgi:hypothetical protein
MSEGATYGTAIRGGRAHGPESGSSAGFGVAQRQAQPDLLGHGDTNAAGQDNKNRTPPTLCSSFAQEPPEVVPLARQYQRVCHSRAHAAAARFVLLCRRSTGLLTPALLQMPGDAVFYGILQAMRRCNRFAGVVFFGGESSLCP